MRCLHMPLVRLASSLFQAAVAVPLGLCGIPFMAASKGNKQTKGMPGNLLGPIEGARDSAREEKAGLWNHSQHYYRCEERHYEPAHSKHLSDVVRPGRDHLRRQGAFTAWHLRIFPDCRHRLH